MGRRLGRPLEAFRAAEAAAAWTGTKAAAKHAARAIAFDVAGGTNDKNAWGVAYDAECAWQDAALEAMEKSGNAADTTN